MRSNPFLSDLMPNGIHCCKNFCSVERLQTIGKISNWLYKGTYSGKCIWHWDERSESLNLKLPAKAASLVCQASGSLHVNLRSLVSTKTQQIVRGDRFQFNWMLKNLLVTVLGWLDFQSILFRKTMQRLSTYRIAREGKDLEELGGRIFPCWVVGTWPCKNKGSLVQSLTHTQRHYGQSGKNRHPNAWLLILMRDCRT